MTMIMKQDVICLDQNGNLLMILRPLLPRLVSRAVHARGDFRLLILLSTYEINKSDDVNASPGPITDYC